MTIGLTALFFIPILYCIFSFANFFNQVDQQVLINNLSDMKIFVQKMISDLVFLNDFLNDLTSKIDIGKTVENILSISA